ncbi:hypothetical protein FOTG_02992 [Fusarium oxysporum f. sp. vasinfectum 25433]|uniref:Uncharacterized protein n=1 Tax=Fusarium oxysporum f. sp. vasinfectum 25433 TaxID=1089449 RepID=X0M3F8_FUSOX|nr:hypothetical protein FOTG_02992 [Fusarium oxysporum f. sp. vasinfectum 25433]
MLRCSVMVTMTLINIHIYWNIDYTDKNHPSWLGEHCNFHLTLFIPLIQSHFRDSPPLARDDGGKPARNGVLSMSLSKPLQIIRVAELCDSIHLQNKLGIAF